MHCAASIAISLRESVSFNYSFGLAGSNEETYGAIVYSLLIGWYQRFVFWMRCGNIA